MSQTKSLPKRWFKPTADQLKLHFRRFEFKYPLTTEQYQAIKSQVQSRLKLDPFAAPSGNYGIESIYLDTVGYKAYYTTKAGLKNRVKYRVRSYLGDKKSNYVFWEIKRKKDAAVYKDRSLLTITESRKLLTGHRFTPTKDEVAKAFHFARLRYCLKPKILVRYLREPFVSYAPDLRITFDHEIKASLVSSDWQPKIWIQTISPQTVIMEFKFTGSLPFWLANLVRHFNLERQPFSKYANSLEALNPKLYG